MFMWCQPHHSTHCCTFSDTGTSTICSPIPSVMLSFTLVVRSDSDAESSASAAGLCINLQLLGHPIRLALLPPTPPARTSCFTLLCPRPQKDVHVGRPSSACVSLPRGLDTTTQANACVRSSQLPTHKLVLLESSASKKTSCFGVPALM